MKQPEPGSTWYIWGKHWTVLGPTTRDGEPAVHLQSRDHPKVKRSEFLPVLARYGVLTR